MMPGVYNFFLYDANLNLKIQCQLINFFSRSCVGKNPYLESKKMEKCSTTLSSSRFNIAAAFSDYNQQKGRILPLEIIYFTRDYFFPFGAHKSSGGLRFCFTSFCSFRILSTQYDIYARTSFAYCNHNSAATYKMHPSLPLGVGRLNCAPWRPFTKYIWDRAWGRNTK